jgi:hypothetical protein
MPNAMTATHPYKHTWRSGAGPMHDEVCVCGVLRNADGSDDDAICRWAVDVANFALMFHARMATETTTGATAGGLGDQDAH